jgi:thiol-disulfide isomerase/thioredoxin
VIQELFCPPAGLLAAPLCAPWDRYFFHEGAKAVIHLTMNMLLSAVALSAGSQDYATAFKHTEETGKPLVVLIGADWCPGCRTMKHSTMPQIEKSGSLKKVAFAYVNTDQDGALAGKLMKGGSIPQLVMFQKTDKGWTRKQLTGAQSTSSVEQFLDVEPETTTEVTVR